MTMRRLSCNNPTPPSSELQWLYIDFNSYFASVEQQLQPHLRDKPVAVVPVETDSTCAIAVSYEGKAFGIKTGTPIWQARKLCPELICVLARHEYYVEFHHRILEEVDHHIPVTAVCSIDEMACRLMSNETSIERVTTIAKAIKCGLAANIGEYVRCSIGVAANRYLAKVATDLQKPNGFTILQAQDLPQGLFTLKPRDLPGIGRNLELRLIKAGITDMPALWALNTQRMRQIWGGVLGERMWHQLRGVELPEEETSRRSIGHSHVLAPELRDPAKAKQVARRLTLKAASRLRRLEYYAGSLSLAAQIVNGPHLEGSLRCFRAQDSMTFLGLVDELWASLEQHTQGASIKKVSITLQNLIPVDGLQAELFDVLPDTDLRKRVKAEKISQALDKINHRFGQDSVLVGLLPSENRRVSGTKIAFTRIPDREEFME